MKTERREHQFAWSVRPLLVAFRHSLQTFGVAIVLLLVTIRRIGHLVLLPYYWMPARWERSPLSRASVSLAKMAVDAMLVAAAIAVTIELIW
jgi:hypothetical protein